jgi:hypothetical protein
MTEIQTRDDSDRMMRIGSRKHLGGQQYPKMFGESRWTPGSIIDKIRARFQR